MKIKLQDRGVRKAPRPRSNKAEYPPNKQLRIMADAIAMIGGGGTEFEKMHAALSGGQGKKLQKRGKR